MGSSGANIFSGFVSCIKNMYLIDRTSVYLVAAMIVLSMMCKLICRYNIIKYPNNFHCSCGDVFKCLWLWLNLCKTRGWKVRKPYTPKFLTRQFNCRIRIFYCRSRFCMVWINWKYTIRSIVCEASRHLVTWSLCHMVTQSLGHSVTRSLGHSVAWSLGHSVTFTIFNIVTDERTN